MMLRKLRPVMVLLMTGIWGLLSRILSPRIIFLVYGNARQRRYYWPAWIDPFLPLVFPIGLIRHKSGWGLIAATKIAEEDLDEKPQLVSSILAAARGAFPLAHTIALAGRLPSFARRTGVPITRPFLDGMRGAHFTVRGAVRAACEQYGIKPSDLTVAVVGGSGYIGSTLVHALGSDGYCRRVVAVDPQAPVSDSMRICSTRDPRAIRQAKVVVNLARRGDDAGGYVEHLNPGTIVLDDTHPPMHHKTRAAVAGRNAELWKVVVEDPTLRMIPRLPDFGPSWVPGCLLEAVVVNHSGWSAVENGQEEFDRAAQASGIVPQLFRHKADP